MTQTLDLPIIPSVRSSYTSAGNRIIQNKISISYGLIKDDFVCERRAELPLVFLCGKACIKFTTCVVSSIPGLKQTVAKIRSKPVTKAAYL